MEKGVNRLVASNRVRFDKKSLGDIYGPIAALRFSFGRLDLVLRANPERGLERPAATELYRIRNMAFSSSIAAFGPRTVIRDKLPLCLKIIFIQDIS